MHRMIRSGLVIAGLTLSTLQIAYGQAPKLNGGEWLRDGIASYNRVNSIKAPDTPTVIEFTDSVMVQYFILGVFSALQTNRYNLQMDITIFTKARELSLKEGDKKEVQRYDGLINTIWSYMPMFDPPENVSPAQLIAVTQKYVSSHPEKWANKPDVIIKDALCEAFPLQRLK